VYSMILLMVGLESLSGCKGPGCGTSCWRCCSDGWYGGGGGQARSSPGEGRRDGGRGGCVMSNCPSILLW
jgi:hypothetical protein